MAWLPLVRIVIAVPDYFEEEGKIVAVLAPVVYFVVVAAAAVVVAAFSTQTLLDWHPAVLALALLVT